ARPRPRPLRQARRRSTRPAVPRAGARRRPHPGGGARARDARARRGRGRRCGGAAPGRLPPMSRHAGAGEARAPEPERAPEGPTDLTKPSWTYVLRRTVREMLRDQCTDLAAALTYYSVLSLFPALIAMLSLLALTGQQEDTVATVLDTLRQAGAASAADTLEPVLTELSQTPRAGLVLIGGLAVALWSASNYVNSFGRAMNRIYEIDEGRPIWKLRPVMLVLTALIVVLAALVALGLVITGPVARAIGDVVGLGAVAVTVWNVAKWPVMLAVVVIVALLYFVTPNVRQPRFRWISVGAVVAILTWVVASALFGLYVASFSSYNAIYGSLAGVIVFLLWLWITNLALLFGAELDAELERGRELQAGVAAERRVQLPLKDDAAIVKKERTRA